MSTPYYIRNPPESWDVKCLLYHTHAPTECELPGGVEGGGGGGSCPQVVASRSTMKRTLKAVAMTSRDRRVVTSLYPLILERWDISIACFNIVALKTGYEGINTIVIRM